MVKTFIPQLKDHLHLIQKALDTESIDEKNKILKQALLLLDTVLVYNLSIKNEESPWPTYDQPGQCGLCGSFMCSGTCFK